MLKRSLELDSALHGSDQEAHLTNLFGLQGKALKGRVSMNLLPQHPGISTRHWGVGAWRRYCLLWCL